MANNESRPRGITVISVLSLVCGAYYFVVLSLGILKISVLGTSTDVQSEATLLIELLCGIVSVVVAYGIWAGWNIIWLVAVIFSAMSLLFGLSQAHMTVSLFCAVLEFIILWFLLDPKVKDCYKIR